MCDREFLVDRYDLAIVRDELDCEIRKLYDTEICPIKTSLKQKKVQIDGLGEIVIMLSENIDEIKHNNNKITKELNEHINMLNNVVILSVSLSIFSIVCLLSF